MSPTQPNLFNQKPDANADAGADTDTDAAAPVTGASDAGPPATEAQAAGPGLSPADAEAVAQDPAAPAAAAVPWPPVPPRAAPGRPVCYVLEDYGLSNALILDRACREAGLPSPLRPLPGDPLGRRRAYVALSRRNAGGALALATGQAPPKKTHSESLARLLDAHRTDPALDVQLVPVSIFVGRSPDKASGWFSVLFSENWAIVGRSRRLLSILLNGRDTLVQFAAPVDMRGLLAEDLTPERTVRKLSRLLRTHFNRIRE